MSVVPAEKNPRRRYEPYPKYKESGVEWLGEIPAGWDVKPMRWSVCVRSGEALANSEFELDRKDGLDVSVVGGNGVMGYTNRVNTNSACIAIGRVGALCGNVHLVDPPAWVTDNALLVSDLKGFDRQYLALLFLVLDLNRWASQNAQPLITGSFVKAQQICSPPSVEQGAIVAFIAGVMARIDGLVAKKERLIELLQEKRTALITRAVTKGLDPNVPMKDSGVEWLGEIPAHWEAVKLKHATSRIVDCPHETPVYSDDGDHHVVRTADVSEGCLDLSNTRRVDDREYALRIQRSALMAGDVVYSREGERFGFAALVPEGVSACLGQRMMQFRLSPHWWPKFMMWHLNSRATYQQACLDTAGSTSPHINVGTIKGFWLSQPSLAEQRSVADFIDHETASIDALVSKIRTAIDRLRELRTALISAAVTGKIDVREEAP